jgi:hypothetical protein
MSFLPAVEPKPSCLLRLLVRLHIPMVVIFCVWVETGFFVEDFMTYRYAC